MGWFVKLFNYINTCGILGSMDDLYAHGASGLSAGIFILAFSVVSLRMIRNEEKALTWLRVFGVLVLVLTALFGLALPAALPFCILLIAIAGRVFHFC